MLEFVQSKNRYLKDNWNLYSQRKLCVLCASLASLRLKQLNIKHQSVLYAKLKTIQLYF